jgi:hypothetical protein
MKPFGASRRVVLPLALALRALALLPPTLAMLPPALAVLPALPAVCQGGACEAQAAVVSGSPAKAGAAGAGERGGGALESAAARAGSTGRAVAMSLIGLAFAVAATVLAFRRDFKEAASVFAVGIVAVLLATPTGLSLLRDTVASLFGAQ